MLCAVKLCHFYSRIPYNFLPLYKNLIYCVENFFSYNGWNNFQIMKLSLMIYSLEFPLKGYYLNFLNERGL